MLKQMTTAQYLEVLAYFEVKARQKAEGEAEADEANTMQELAREAARKKE
jgi:hypothetical protein